MIWTLALAGGVYAVSLMRGPCEDALTAAAAARVDALMQRRLVRAVSAPAGIEHLEDEGVRERLASARGELLGATPEGAPMALVSSLGDRLTGVLACAVLATFRWWLGLSLLLVWLLVRRPLGARVRFQATRARQAGPQLRRSWYLLGLAWRPPAAKEMRVFGLGDWTAGRHRDEWLAGMQATWQELRRLSTQVWLAGGLLLAAYALAAGTVGWTADHGEISLRTLATMLPMLPVSMAVGSITLADISLAQMLASVPDLDALTNALRHRAPTANRAEGGDAAAPPLPADGLPRRGVRFAAVTFTNPGRPEPVLRSLELELRFGESLGLVGVNGAGKTTLVTLLATHARAERRSHHGRRRSADAAQRARVAAPGGGRLPGLRAVPVQRRRERGPVRRRPSRSRPARAGGRPGGRGRPHRPTPARLGDDLSPHYEGGVGLSGGQWQRIALARALYAIETGSRVLVLDEPTAQLDVRAEAMFYDRFLELTAGVTSIVISHRFGSVGFKVMIDAAIARDTGQIALGAALVATLFTLSWLLALVSSPTASPPSAPRTWSWCSRTGGWSSRARTRSSSPEAAHTPSCSSCRPGRTRDAAVVGLAVAGAGGVRDRVRQRVRALDAAPHHEPWLEPRRDRCRLARLDSDVGALHASMCPRTASAWPNWCAGPASRRSAEMILKRVGSRWGYLRVVPEPSRPRAIPPGRARMARLAAKVFAYPIVWAGQDSRTAADAPASG
jgi:ATP-binding cassette, subfamily B, bacterial